MDGVIATERSLPSSQFVPPSGSAATRGHCGSFGTIRFAGLSLGTKGCERKRRTEQPNKEMRCPTPVVTKRRREETTKKIVEESLKEFQTAVKAEWSKKRAA